MKTLYIKTGNAKIGKFKNGFDFDIFTYSVIQSVKSLSVTMPCCNPIKLIIKPSSVIKAQYNTENKGFFNLEQWVRKTLFDLSVIDQDDLDDLCCPTKMTTFIHSSYIYTGKKEKENMIDLRKRLKYLLDEWSVPYTDPCCP